MNSPFIECSKWFSILFPRASLEAQTVIYVCLQHGRPGFDPWVGKIPWRRKWQPTPVLLPGKFHGLRSLVGYSPWGRKESDTTERLHFLSLSDFTFFQTLTVSNSWKRAKHIGDIYVFIFYVYGEQTLKSLWVSSPEVRCTQTFFVCWTVVSFQNCPTCPKFYGLVHLFPNICCRYTRKSALFPASDHSHGLNSHRAFCCPRQTPWMEELGRLKSMGSRRVGYNWASSLSLFTWASSLSLFTFMHWRRKWQPTPVFLPGESQGWQSLVGCHLWGHIELDTTEAT